MDEEAAKHSHIEQAGNHGDVLKHVVLRATLKAQQMAHPEGMLYVDTHAGPGLYDLAEQESSEYEKGVLRISKNIDDAPKQVKHYFQIVKSADSFLQNYPGSPIIAERMMRKEDEMRLCDLFVSEVQGLKKEPTLENGDSFHPEAVQYFLPDTDRHPVIFIDPSYVDQEDFFRAKQLMERILEENSHATVILWYPLIEGSRYRYNFGKQLKDMAEKKAAVGYYSCFVTVQKKGLQGSTMFIANPTKEFDEILSEETLDYLSCILLKSGRSDYAVDQWMKKPRRA